MLTLGPLALRVETLRVDQHSVRTPLGGCVRGAERGRPDLDHRAAPADREAGFTLVELLVVVPLLLVVTTLVLSTLMTAYAAESKVQATSQASSQVTTAFMELDNEIRYAADINVPGTYNNNYYVEFESAWTQNASQAQSLCTQLEYSTSNGTLQQRSWLSNASAPSTWQPLATGLKTSLGTDPFSLSAPATSLWQLSIALSSATGAAQSSFTITALDTTTSSTSQGVCGGTP